MATIHELLRFTHQDATFSTKNYCLAKTFLHAD